MSKRRQKYETKVQEVQAILMNFLNQFDVLDSGYFLIISLLCFFWTANSLFASMA